MASGVIGIYPTKTMAMEGMRKIKAFQPMASFRVVKNGGFYALKATNIDKVWVKK